jgi:large subunit ribosomal protein L21
MYAIVEGKQFRVEKDKYLYSNRIDKEVGAKIEFEDVYLVDNNGKVSVGAPTVKGAKVTATVVEHAKGDKVIVFHKKRRKGYRKTNGHRQYVTKLQIDAISA